MSTSSSRSDSACCTPSPDVEARAYSALMLSTQSKLRYIVGAGVLALILLGSVALSATRRAAVGGPDDPTLRLAQALVIILIILAVVLAWFAYASLHDDLVQRTTVEQALRASEAKFSGILEIAADAIISVDERQRIVHYNLGAERIFGWTAAEAMIGRSRIQTSAVLPSSRKFTGHRAWRSYQFPARHCETPAAVIFPNR